MGPSVDTDSGAQSPDLQLHMPSPPSLDVEEKSSKFSFGFGKGKKKKEKSPKPIAAEEEKQLAVDDLPPPKPPRLDTHLDGMGLSSHDEESISVFSGSTIIPGSEINVSLSDGDVVPKMGVSAKLIKAEIETPVISAELPTNEVSPVDVTLEKKGSFSFGFGSKRDKKKKSKNEEDKTLEGEAGLKIDTSLPDVDGGGVMKNWYKEKSKSPTKEKKKANSMNLGFGGKGKETSEVDIKPAELEVPQEVKVKKRGSFLGGLMKKGSKAKDVEDVSLKYKGKLKDNEGTEENLGLETSLKGDATGVTLDLDLPSVELKGPEISNGGTTKGFKLFNNAPDHKDGVTLNGEAPKASLDTDISGGEMEAELPSIKDLPSVKGPNQIEVSTPSITADLKTPS